MKMIRYNPWFDLQRDIDRFFFGHSRKFDLDYYSNPSADFYENRDAYLIKMDLPGFDKKDIKIESDFETLEISVNYDENNSEEKESDTGSKYIIRERRHGEFTRRFNFPTAVEPSKSKITFNEGVLAVEVPKAEDSKRVSLNIE